MSEIKRGDRVKVTVEGLAYNNGQYTVVSTDDGEWLVEYKNGQVGNGLTVEKIEPPVEVFGPGVVVRSKESGTLRAPLAGGGWVNITTGKVYEGHGRLTSESYERVL